MIPIKNKKKITFSALIFLALIFILSGFKTFVLKRSDIHGSDEQWKQLVQGSDHFLNVHNKSIKIIPRLKTNAIQKNTKNKANKFKQYHQVNAHQVRDLLLKPMMILAKLFNINIHIIFSLFCLIALIIISIILEKILWTVTKTTFLNRNLIFLLFTTFSFLFMNGRGVSLFLNNTILLFFMLNFLSLPLYYTPALALFSLYFSSLSTGVFGLTYLILFLYPIAMIIKDKILFQKRHFILLYVTLLFFIPVFYLTIKKNLLAYTESSNIFSINSIFRLITDHGAIATLLNLDILYLTLIFVFLIAFSILFIYIPLPFFLKFATLFGLMGLTLGYTTGVSILVPTLFLIVCLMIHKFKDKRTRDAI